MKRKKKEQNIVLSLKTNPKQQGSRSFSESGRCLSVLSGGKRGYYIGKSAQRAFCLTMLRAVV